MNHIGRTTAYAMLLAIALTPSCASEKPTAARERSAAPVAPVQIDEDNNPDLLANGSFESYDYNWYQPAASYSGQLDPAVSIDGVHSWRMELDSEPATTYISTSTMLDRRKSYILSVAVRSLDVTPADAVRIRIEEWSGGKPQGVVRIKGRQDAIVTGGNHGWKSYRVQIRPGDLRPDTDQLTVYARAEAGASGIVWFDGFQLVPDDESVSLPEEELIGPPITRDRVATTARTAARVKQLYASESFGVLDGFVLDATIPADATRYEVRNYFGETLERGTVPVDRRIRYQPRNAGYYEIRLYSQDSEPVASSSFARPAIPVRPVTDEDFILGSWIQQEDLLPTMGARWTRLGIGWRYLEPEPGVYAADAWALTERMLRQARANGIRVIFLFSNVPEWAGAGRGVVAPGNWNRVRALVRRTVQQFGDLVDVWEPMNEPYIGHQYDGTLDDIVRWHRIVFEEVRRNDPDGVVIGPCANPRAPELFQQFSDLVDMGIGDFLDGISVHTYGGLESGGFRRDLLRSRNLFLEKGMDYPVYITEHGLSVPPELELERLQAQNVARTLAMSMELRVEALIWHMMSWPQGDREKERNYAIVRNEIGAGGRSPRPAFVAATTASRFLGNTRFVGRVEAGGETTRTFLFESPVKKVWMVWDFARRDQPVTIDVADATVRGFAIDGSPMDISVSNGSTTVVAGPDPIYIVSE